MIDDDPKGSVRVAAALACLVLAAACGNASSGGGNVAARGMRRHRRRRRRAHPLDRLRRADARVPPVRAGQQRSHDGGAAGPELPRPRLERARPGGVLGHGRKGDRRGLHHRRRRGHRQIVEHRRSLLRAGERAGRRRRPGHARHGGAHRSEYCIDPQRIFSTGMSNGGFMSNRLACVAADLIAAITSVAGDRGPGRLRAVAAGAGPDVQRHARSAGALSGAGNSFVRWQGFNGCTGARRDHVRERRRELRDLRAVRRRRDHHAVHDRRRRAHLAGTDILLPQFGATSADIDATDAMWDFFVAHPKP